MHLVLKYLEKQRESILMDLELIKNDTKTRYAIEKRKQLEPFLEQITRAVAILSSVPQANELLPHVSNNEADCKYKYSCGHDYCNLDGCPEYEPIDSEVAVCNCKIKEPCTFTEHGKIVEKCINCAKPIAY